MSLSLSLRLSSVAALGKGGASAIDSILGAGGLDYAFFDAGKTDRLFQENIGPTPANTFGAVVGLGIGAEKQGSRTLAQFLSGQAELRGTGTPAIIGSATPATYNTATGAGSAARVDVGNQSFVTFAATVNRLYGLDIEVVSGTALVRAGNGGGAILGTFSPGTRQTVYIAPTSAPICVTPSASNGVTTSFIIHSLKLVPARYAAQASPGFKPQLQPAGIKLDGQDDNLLTDWFAQAGANCLIMQTTFPATVVATQIVAGTQSGVPNQRFWLGVSTSFTPAFGVGNVVQTATGGADMRGREVIIALTFDGATIRVFYDGAQVWSGAQNGDPITTVPFRLGSANSNGAATSFTAASIRRIAFGRKDLTLEEFQRIRSEWLAA